MSNHATSVLRGSLKRMARHAAFYAGLVAVWVILARLRIWPPYVFPSPQGVFESLRSGFATTCCGGAGSIVAARWRK